MNKISTKNNATSKAKKKKITYENGNVFIGIVKDGKPYKGELTYVNGNTFKGKFKNGEPYKGILTNKGEFTYDGELKNGKPHGKGILTYTDGMTYEGEFKDGKLHGEAKITFPNGDVITSKFEEGELTHLDGAIHESEYEKGLKSESSIISKENVSIRTEDTGTEKIHLSPEKKSAFVTASNINDKPKGNKPKRKVNKSTSNNRNQGKGV